MANKLQMKMMIGSTWNAKTAGWLAAELIAENELAAGLRIADERVHFVR